MYCERAMQNKYHEKSWIVHWRNWKELLYGCWSSDIIFWTLENLDEAEKAILHYDVTATKVDPTAPRNPWPLGRVMKTLPGDLRSCSQYPGEDQTQHATKACQGQPSICMLSRIDKNPYLELRARTPVQYEYMCIHGSVGWYEQKPHTGDAIMVLKRKKFWMFWKKKSIWSE